MDPGTFVAELARSGFSGQQVDDYLHSRAATATLRRTVLGEMAGIDDSRVVEAWWLTCPRPPEQALTTRLARSDALTARELAAGLHAEHPGPSEFVDTRRPELLLPEFLRRGPVSAVQIGGESRKGWWCGAVLRRLPTCALDEDGRSKVEALLFQRWVDDRPENADVQWHWHA
jgi:hypothetical protein